MAPRSTIYICLPVCPSPCVDGSPQRDYIPKEVSSSPAFGTASLFLTLIVDATKCRHVVTADIVGTYLNVLMETFILMSIDGSMVDFLVGSNKSKYAPFVTKVFGKRAIYLRLKRSLYSCAQSSLLWYKLLTKTLVKKMGSTLNPYDGCVANKIIECKQATIVWCVDDLKISHVSKSVVTTLVHQIESLFGKMTGMSGDLHTYVGMEIEFKEGEVHIFNNDYLLETIELFGEELGASSATPVKSSLFQVTPDHPLLNEKKKTIFHSCVAKLLYTATRGRLDILTNIAFLTTRVQSPSINDWGKLKRCLQNIQGPLDLKLTLVADSLVMCKTWVDTSYAPRSDMRGRTGGCLSFGKGMIISRSSKQKLNSKSSTEAELIGVIDVLPYSLWKPLLSSVPRLQS